MTRKQPTCLEDWIVLFYGLAIHDKMQENDNEFVSSIYAATAYRQLALTEKQANRFVKTAFKYKKKFALEYSFIDINELNSAKPKQPFREVVQIDNRISVQDDEIILTFKYSENLVKHMGAILSNFGISRDQTKYHFDYKKKTWHLKADTLGYRILWRFMVHREALNREWNADETIEKRLGELNEIEENREKYAVTLDWENKQLVLRNASPVLEEIFEQHEILSRNNRLAAAFFAPQFGVDIGKRLRDSLMSSYSNKEYSIGFLLTKLTDNDKKRVRNLMSISDDSILLRTNELKQLISDIDRDELILELGDKATRKATEGDVKRYHVLFINRGGLNKRADDYCPLIVKEAYG